MPNFSQSMQLNKNDKTILYNTLTDRLYYEHSCFIDLLFSALKALSKAKTINKNTKNAPFYARSGNE